MAASCAMKVSPAVAQPLVGRRVASRASAKAFLPIRIASRTSVATFAQQKPSVLETVGVKVEHAVAVSTAVSTFLLAGNAQAAQEIAAIAADNRFGTISLLFVPVLGWVGLNILGPAFNQLDSMTADAPASTPKKGTKRVKKASVAAAVGAGLLATMLTASSVEAATEVSQLAASDNRVSAILTLLVPALGWVAFNILGPAFNQLNSMSGDVAPAKKATTKVTKRRSVGAAVGLATAASMLAVESANAATEFAQVADSDSRVGVILTLFVPALGWVAFNILGPAFNQLNAMSGDVAPAKKATTKVTKRRSVGAAVGLATAASMLAVESANAATEFAQVADSDSRVGVILTLFVPAVAWVAFNIFGPALRQLDTMSGDSPAPKKSTTKVTKKKK